MRLQIHLSERGEVSLFIDGKFIQSGYRNIDGMVMDYEHPDPEPEGNMVDMPHALDKVDRAVMKTLVDKIYQDRLAHGTPRYPHHLLEARQLEYRSTRRGVTANLKEPYYLRPAALRLMKAAFELVVWGDDSLKLVPLTRCDESNWERLLTVGK